MIDIIRYVKDRATARRSRVKLGMTLGVTFKHVFWLEQGKHGMFCKYVLVLLATRTVNLNKLACVLLGDALQSSRYRRIQRFFSKFPLDYPSRRLLRTLLRVNGGTMVKVL